MQVKDETGEVLYWLSILELMITERRNMIIPNKWWCLEDSGVEVICSSEPEVRSSEDHVLFCPLSITFLSVSRFCILALSVGVSFSKKRKTKMECCLCLSLHMSYFEGYQPSAGSSDETEAWICTFKHCWTTHAGKLVLICTVWWRDESFFSSLLLHYSNLII